MDQRDVAALNKSFAVYKKLSPRARAEISGSQLRGGWKSAAICHHSRFYEYTP
jgi:hypothetical protein